MNPTTRANAPVTAHSIELVGDYDLSRKAELESLFDSLSADGPATIDLTRVDYVDSTFRHVLATLHFRLGGYGVTLIGASDSIRRLLGIVRFDQLFHIA